jgi:signal peptidase II
LRAALPCAIISPEMPFGKNQRIALVAAMTVLLDFFTKLVVLRGLDFHQEREIIPGFFKFVHWRNTGAAWSFWSGNNEMLAIISLVALLLLFVYRNHFDTRTFLGQAALGLIFGGITGNLIDRLYHRNVVDFLRFYINQRGGTEIGFPAFNIADTAICTGVGLLFLLARQADQNRAPQPAAERP